MTNAPASRAPSSPLDELTDRERQILERVAVGDSNKEIGERLNLTEKTVKHHVSNILQKLQVRNRVEAALLARTGGADPVGYGLRDRFVGRGTHFAPDFGPMFRFRQPRKHELLRNDVVEPGNEPESVPQRRSSVATRGKAGDMERLMRLGRVGIALMWALAMVTAWGAVAFGDVSAAAGRSVNGPSALFKDGRSGDDNGAADVNDDNGGDGGMTRSMTAAMI